MILNLENHDMKEMNVDPGLSKEVRAKIVYYIESSFVTFRSL